MAQEPVKIVLVIEGGVLQEVISCGVPIEYALIDYDAAGNEPEDIFQVPQQDGTVSDAVGHLGTAQLEPAIGLDLFDCVAKHHGLA
ncbi:MAG: hypothetical protein ACYC3W_07070 [Candidatus Nanopelagicales bacterium]